ncbi:hypothetical protein M8J76_013838 [Diaphorina citri]|nr:hypothetical protein M8J76_013838 [Diaphorina citri]
MSEAKEGDPGGGGGNPLPPNLNSTDGNAVVMETTEARASSGAQNLDGNTASSGQKHLILYKPGMRCDLYKLIVQLKPNLDPTPHSTNDRNQVYNFDDKKPKPLSARLRNIHSVNIDSLHPVCIKTQDPPWTLNIPEVEYLFNDKKINISSAECTQKFLKYLNERNDFAPCFTDGSKCTDSTSCAFVYENKPCKIKLNSICSVFTAEMFAIHFCLEHISKTYPRPKDKFIVFSDSKSALQCLLQPFPTNPICLNIRSLLLDLKFCHGIEILFTWIPSHHGISGNVLVDTAANEAHTTPDVNVQEVTADDIKSTFKQDHRKKVRLRSKCLKWLLSDSDDIASQVIRFLRISKLFNKL